jgi:4-hydroxybenzoate polyprenyltransferase
MVSFKRLVLISRPICYPLTVAVYGAGLITHSRTGWSWSTLLIALYFTLPGSIILYGINDIADRESDAQNTRKGGMDGAALKREEVKSLVNIIVVLAIVVPLLFALSNHVLMALLVASFSILAYVYSVRPIRLKSIPIIDSLSNALGTLLVFITGYWATQTFSNVSFPPPHLIAAIVLFTIGIHAIGTVADYAVDKAAGDHTISVLLGKSLTLTICAACFAACYFLVGNHNIFIGIYVTLCAIATLLAIKIQYPRFVRNLGLGIVLGFPLAMLPIIL